MRLALLFLASGGFVCAHVGSPDIFLEGNAGPYPLFVTIRPPVVIPGVAEVEIRVRSKEISQVRIVPTPVSGAGARFAPTPDVAQRSSEDAQYFTGGLWMMTTGSWQVRVLVDGAMGKGELAVPVPALASRTETMQFGLGAVLAVLTVILVLGAISIAGAALREGHLEPGKQPQPAHRRKARIAMGVTALIVAGILYRGNAWWNDEANNYARIIYKPLQMKPSFEAGLLQLNLSDPGWLPRKVDDFVPDHNHLMHLYVIRLPEMERVWHLHPEMTSSGVFTHPLPSMPAGRYGLYADVVHESGLPETIVAEVDLPQVAGKPLAGDDAAGMGPGITQGKTGATTFTFADGSRLIWEREFDIYPTRKPHAFRFRIEGADGKPVPGMQLYMGMLGHAAFVKHDRTVFAHVHPTGSVPMASLSIVQKTAEDPHQAHRMHAALASEVSFPYGFPQPGDYRIFVQFKRSDQVYTGVFDTKVK